MKFGLSVIACGLLLTGCATNFAERAAAQCGPVSSDPSIYSSCVQTAETRLRQNHQKTWSVVAAALGGAASAGQSQPAGSSGTAFLQRDFVSGTNRTCVYRGLGGDEYFTIPSAQLCPLTK